MTTNQMPMAATAAVLPEQAAAAAPVAGKDTSPKNPTVTVARAATATKSARRARRVSKSDSKSTHSSPETKVTDLSPNTNSSPISPSTFHLINLANEPITINLPKLTLQDLQKNGPKTITSVHRTPSKFEDVPKGSGKGLMHVKQTAMERIFGHSKRPDKHIWPRSGLYLAPKWLLH
jgi:hypothetical protein